MVDPVADTWPTPLHELPIMVHDALFGLPSIRYAVAVSIALLKLSIVEQFRPEAVLNGIVLFLDEVSKQKRGDFPCNLPGINFDDGLLNFCRV